MLIRGKRLGIVLIRSYPPADQFFKVRPHDIYRKNLVQPEIMFNCLTQICHRVYSNLFLTVFTARCSGERGSCFVRPSVCQSVCDVHVTWSYSYGRSLATAKDHYVLRMFFFGRRFFDVIQATFSKLFHMVALFRAILIYRCPLNKWGTKPPNFRHFDVSPTQKSAVI